TDARSRARAAPPARWRGHPGQTLPPPSAWVRAGRNRRGRTSKATPTLAAPAAPASTTSPAHDSIAGMVRRVALSWGILLAAACATTGGQAARVVAGCQDAVAIDVTVQGSVAVHDHGRVRRAVLRAEQREDLDRLLFAAGARGW